MAGSAKVSMSQMMEILNSGRDADRERTEPIYLTILVDSQASRPLVEAVRDAFLPTQPTSEVQVFRLGDQQLSRAFRPDLCVIIGGGSDELVNDAAESYARGGVPVAIVAETLLDAPAPHLPESLSWLVGVAVASEHTVMLDRLARWIVVTSPKSTAFAANFPFCRKAKVDELVRACASRNAAIGAVGRAGGSDSTSMTSNQARLALDIAAAYGRPMTIDRAVELAGVVSAGMGYRSFARASSQFIPGVDWAFKAGVGYLGTMATANAITSHFEREDSGAKPLPRVRALAGAVASVLPSALSSVSDVRRLAKQRGQGDDAASGQLALGEFKGRS